MAPAKLLRKSRCRGVANAARNLSYSLLARFEEKSSLLYPARNQIMAHALAKPRTPTGQARRAAPNRGLSKVDLVARGSNEALSRCAGLRSQLAIRRLRDEELDPASQHLDKEHFGHSREHHPLTGALESSTRSPSGRVPFRATCRPLRVSDAGEVGAIPERCSARFAINESSRKSTSRRVLLRHRDERLRDAPAAGRDREAGPVAFCRPGAPMWGSPRVTRTKSPSAVWTSCPFSTATTAEPRLR